MTPYERLVEHERSVAKAFGVSDALVGIRTSWWRRWWQRHVTRRP